ncbi:MAG: GNAT family N-acetyltransferase [Terriglobales bacterium]
MDSFPIRFAEASEASQIARLINIAFRSERFFIDADRTDAAKVADLFDKGKFLLLFADSVLAGCVYAELRGERGYFGLLAVDPSRQHSGLGGKLVTAAEDYCRTAGCKFMDLTFVNVRLELPGYYARFGYSENGTLPFPTDQATPKIPVHLVRMSKPL